MVACNQNWPALPENLGGSRDVRDRGNVVEVEVLVARVELVDALLIKLVGKSLHL